MVGREMIDIRIVPDKYDRLLFVMMLSHGVIEKDGSFTRAWMKYLKRSGFVK